MSPGDHLAVESITKPGRRSTATSRRRVISAKASEADLILDNGLNLEVWFAQFVDSVDVPHVVVSEEVDASTSPDAYAGKPIRTRG